MAAPRTSGPMIAWITTDLEALDDPDRDIEPVTVALAARGVGVEPVRWRASPDPDWSRFTCAVIRSPWDYPEHLETFASWLESVEAALPVFNEPDTIRWNLDKSYLPELEQAGVPIVPTALCDSGTGVRDEFQRLWSAGHARVVVKPNISAGSRDTGLFAIDDPAAQRLAEQIVVSRRRVVVQPEIPSVATDGERGMIVIDGVFSHAIHKGPILALGGGLLGDVYTENVTAVAASPVEIALAERVVRACPGAVPLYARIDVVATAGGPALLEAELFEPSLFCDVADGSADRFASAIARRVARLA